MVVIRFHYFFLECVNYKWYNQGNKKRIEVAMQISTMLRRHPVKHRKGNHRRMIDKGIYLLWGYELIVITLLQCYCRGANN